MTEWGIRDDRGDGKVEFETPDTTWVLPGEEAGRIGQMLLRVTTEPTYAALTEDEQALAKLGLLGKGIRDTFYSVQDAVAQMQEWITELERERDMLRGLLTDEQQKVAYPGPEEWIKENDVVTLDGIIVRYRSQMTIEETDCLIDVREELRKLRAASITTLVKCAKCENGVRPKFAICGLCNECARKEMIRLWGEMDALLARDIPELQEEIQRRRRIIMPLETDKANLEREVKKLKLAVKFWLEEEKDWKAEEKRLREIEIAIRECPTSITRLGGVKALVYTTQLRDALGAKP